MTDGTDGIKTKQICTCRRTKLDGRSIFSDGRLVKKIQWLHGLSMSQLTVCSVLDELHMEIDRHAALNHQGGA